MADRKYKVYHNGKLTKKILAETRSFAVKKAKAWFYRQRKNNSKKKIEGKARVTLVVSDPYEEVSYHPNFDTSIDENNFLARSTIRRIVKQSKGGLKQSSKKELEKDLRQIKRTKNFKAEDNRVKIRQLLSIPLLHKKGNECYYYSITENGRSKYIELESRTPDGCVVEIKKRKLFRMDESKNARLKMERLRINCEAIKKIIWVMRIFDGQRMQWIRYKNSRSVSSLEIKNTFILFNPNWVMRSTEKDIMVEARRRIREAELV
jgi:hypothetical protein